MKRNYRGGRKRLSAAYIIGITILAIATVIAVRGMILNSKDPSSTAMINTSPNASPKPSGSPNATPAASPGGNMDYTAVSKTEDDMYQGKLILVNREHPYKFVDFEKFVNVYENKTSNYLVSDTDIFAGNDIMSPLSAMLGAFYAQSGIKDVYIISGYRTFDRQQALYQSEVRDKGEAEAAYWVAKPGTSEHHTGLAIDFGLFNSSGQYVEYDGKGSYAWVNFNSYKYGFIVRYKEAKKSITNIYYEPWHFRYVGIPHATEITKLGFCLEEYIDFLRDYSYNNPLQISTDDGSVYKTYFCKGLTVYVPKSGDYEISGNNVDGFIVTVKVS